MHKLLILAFLILASCSGKMYQKFEEIFQGEKIEFEAKEEVHFGPGPEKRVEVGERNAE